MAFSEDIMNFDIISSSRMLNPGKPLVSLSNRPEEDGVKCPYCGDNFIFFGVPRNETFHGDPWLVIPFKGECGHFWDLIFEYHKGSSSTFIRFYIEEEPVDYQSYIASSEWREKSEAAKERAGQRCQTCNSPRSSTTLDTHHRTYERLGQEQNEDLIVLCRKCHDLFHKNGKLAR